MSGIGVTGRKRTPRSYRAHLYYTMKDMFEWIFYFVITRDLDAMNAVVRVHLGHFAREAAVLRVMFEHSEITLDIPEEGLVTREGWRIIPFTYPTVISQEDVDQFKPGRCIPQCQLVVQWTRKDQRPMQLRHRVNLIGAKPPYNFIHLILNPAMEGGWTERTPSKPQLKDLMNALYHKMADKWKMVGALLQIPKAKLSSIEKKFERDPHICLVEMLETWLEQVDPPATWAAIIEAVEFLGEEQLGKELRDKYSGETSTRVTGGKRKQLEGSEQGTERMPSKPQLKDLMDALHHKVADKWRTIGLYLEIPEGNLAGIAEKCRYNPHSCLVEMLETWLERVDPPATWAAIIEAVEFLGEEQLGKELRENYSEFEVTGGKREQLEGSEQGLEDQLHYRAYQQALKEGVAIPLKYLRVLFFGPPRTGKTSTRRRLVGEIQNLVKEAFQASTGTAECYDVIVKLVEDKISNFVITKSEWSTVKALFQKEKGIHEIHLDEELRLLYQFIYGTVPQIEKRTAMKEQSPAVEAKSLNTVETNPNNSISQEVSSDRGPEHGLNAEESEEIEKAFVAFRKVLHTPRQEQLKVLLNGTILMNMVDTGGQPAFLEMLPALTVGPALYLIFFRLNQELRKRYKIQYVSELNENVQLGESSYTVEEVIFQALSSIMCFSCTTPRKTNMPYPSHVAMLIGTHKDLLGSDPETVIKAKDEALQKSLVEILKTDVIKSGENFLRYASDDQLIFAIDNMTGDEEELQKVRKRLENIIKQEFDDWPIPASWLMFSIFLRKMGKRTMSLLQCYKIGDRLNVKNTDEALWFLHHCVGILMHFPEIDELKDIVICDPQVVFDSVTNLILNSFTFKKVSKQACDKFKETGQFCFKDIQKIAKNLESDSLSLPKLVKLLEYHNIIACIKPGNPLPSSHPPLSSEINPQSYQEENMIYFMPAVLRHANEIELHMKQSSTDPIPLIIHFKCGFVPIGVFCAMIASLVAKMDTLSWTLLDPSYGHTLCKNKVMFRINGAYNLTLISKPKWYEIYIAHISAKGWALEQMCRHVLETVCDTLDQVTSKMRYKQYTISSPSDPTLYELGFKCPEHPNEDHLVINTPMSGIESPSQSAKSLWLNHEKNSVMICQDRSSEGGKAIDLRDRRFSQSFADQSLVWFGEVVETPRLSGSIAGSSPLKPELKDLMDLQVSDWYRLGLALRLNSYDLDIIKKDHPGDTKSQTCNMFGLWLRTQPDASYEQLIKALRKVGDETVANSLRKMYAMCSLESFSKDNSKECRPSHSPEQPISSSSFSPCQWKLSPSSGSQKRRHVPRGRQSRSRSCSPRHFSSSKHQAHSPKSPRRHLHSWSFVHSRSPASRSTSHSHSSKRRRTKSRSHKQRSKSSSPRRRSRSQSLTRKRSRSRSPRHSSSSKHQSRPHSPRTRQDRSQSHSWSPHQPSHSRSLTSKSTSHPHSSERRRSKSRSRSPHKQRAKFHSPRRRSISQSPPRKRSRFCSPRLSNSSRSPRSHRKRPHSQSPHRPSHSRSCTSQSTSHSYSSKSRRSKSRSHFSCKQRSKSSSPKQRSRSRSPRHSSSSRHRSRSQSPRSRRQPHFRSPHQRSHSRSRTSRNTSHSHRPKRRSKPRSRSPLNHSTWSLGGFKTSPRKCSRSCSPRDSISSKC